MRRFGWALSLGIFLLVLATSRLWSGRYALIVSLLLVSLAMVPFFARFEGRQSQAEEIVLIATLAALAAVGRVPFAAIPSVQPMSFVIMMTGLVFGAECGFVTGALAAVVSNFFLGQGPWTPWQMFAWGLMGASSGLLATHLAKHPRIFALFGLVWGFAFGWLMNLWFAVGTGEGLALYAWVAAGIASFPMDLMHGLSNGFLIVAFAKAFYHMLVRIKKKYRL